MNAMSDQVEIIQFTDPVCTWCWGSEPVIRALQHRYGDQVRLSFVMGGLVDDIREFYDQANEIGGDPEQSNKNIAAHWIEASEKHGMPVRTDGFQLFTDEHPSSYPQNIAYKAAEMQSKKLADKFLRRIREATATEARQTNRRDELVGLASEVGLDIVSFINRLEDGTARQAFEEDLQLVREHRVRAFPTFKLVYDNAEIMLNGYQSYATFRKLLDQITDGKIQEKSIEQSEESVLDFIESFDSVAPSEVKMALDLSDAEWNRLRRTLEERELIQKVWAGNGYLIRSAQKRLACGPDSGICAV